MLTFASSRARKTNWAAPLRQATGGAALASTAAAETGYGSPSSVRSRSQAIAAARVTACEAGGGALVAAGARS